MSRSSVEPYLFLGGLLAFMSVIAGVVAFSSNVLVPGFKTGAGIAFVLLVLLTVYCLREIVRIFRPRQTDVRKENWLKDYQCSRCRFNNIERLPGNDISPIPSYRCRNCGTGLITGGTRIMFLAIAVLAAAALVFTLFLVIEEADASIHFGWIALVALGYSVRQLFHGSLRKIDPVSESRS